MTRLFVAIWPPDDVLDALGEVERPRDQGVRWMARDNLHITLRFLGDADEDAVIDALDPCHFPTTIARLGPSFDLPTERSLIIPVTGVDDIAATVVQATRGLGTEPERRRFRGHVTVARLTKHARPTRSAGQRFDATFTVEEVALVASTLTGDGAIYETVTTWPTR